MNWLNSLPSPFHKGNIAVSSNAVDPSFEGYRLFTLDSSVGESALETDAIKL